MRTALGRWYVANLRRCVYCDRVRTGRLVDQRSRIGWMHYWCAIQYQRQRVAQYNSVPEGKYWPQPEHPSTALEQGRGKELTSDQEERE